MSKKPVNPSAVESTRYGHLAIALHWLIGLGLLAQITFGFLLDEIAPRGTPTRGSVINLHKSLGLVLGLLIVLRLLWRLRQQPPPLPASLPSWQRSAATLSHRTLYACMITMPLSGYIASNFSKHGVKFFGTALRPWGSDAPAVYGVFNGLHYATGWLFAALIAVHIAAALKHGLIHRDGIFSRIAPRRSASHS